MERGKLERADKNTLRARVKKIIITKPHEVIMREKKQVLVLGFVVVAFFALILIGFSYVLRFTIGTSQRRVVYAFLVCGVGGYVVYTLIKRRILHS